MAKPLTITEKIILNHTDLQEISSGDIVNARVDLALGNDITAPIAIKEFSAIGVDTVFDRKKIALVPDHFVPNKDILSAKQAKMMREFAKKFDIENYFECGEAGVEHALLPEKRHSPSGRFSDRSRFAYLHIRSAWSFCYRSRFYRFSLCYGIR
jgi:3-isopropylmalate dehydratase, large subunit (EC 4.2.1.33)